MLLKKPGSQNWIFRTKVNGKTWERSTGETNKHRAEAKITEMVALAQLHREQPESCLTLKKAFVNEVDLITKRVSVGEGRHVSDASKHFYTFVGKDIALEKVTPKMLEAYQDQRLSEGASQHTYTREMNYILRMLKRYGFTVIKPTAQRGVKHKHRAFSMPEILEFLRQCNYPNWVLFATMLLTGARPAELIPSPRSNHKPLLKTELDEAEMRLTVRNAKLKRAEDDRLRYVPVPPVLLNDLKAVSKAQDGPYVFARRKYSLHTTFDRYIERAGIPKVDILGRKVTAHSFRHTYCESLAASVGDNPFMVMGLMGHAQITTTQIYCHGAKTKIDVEAVLKTRPVTETKAAKKAPLATVTAAAVGKPGGEGKRFEVQVSG